GQPAADVAGALNLGGAGRQTLEGTQRPAHEYERGASGEQSSRQRRKERKEMETFKRLRDLTRRPGDDDRAPGSRSRSIRERGNIQAQALASEVVAGILRSAGCDHPSDELGRQQRASQGQGAREDSALTVEDLDR